MNVFGKSTGSISKIYGRADNRISKIYGRSYGKRNIVNTINVLNYGATGDGSTDDTTAARSALVAAESLAALLGSATLYFPTGTYNLSSQTGDVLTRAT